MKSSGAMASSLLLVAGLFSGGHGDAQASHPGECTGFSASEVPQYDVKCPAGADSAARCTVDAGTYRGFEIYLDNCAKCHGHGTGVSVSPAADLTHTRIDYEKFHFTLYHGHDGDLGVMPSWKGNCDVMPRIDDLYLYLKARSDGALPLGRPGTQ